jgi:hypothetical protein
MAGVALFLVSSVACNDDRGSDTVHSDASTIATDGGESSDVGGSDAGEECDLFCIWKRYLRASEPAVYVECFCPPQSPDEYRVEQQDLDICGDSEALASEFTVPDVEQDCIEAMSDEMLAELVEYSACITARLAEVEPCLRALGVGDLCSSCESYLTESGDSCIDAALNDTISACMDNRPGF